MDSHALDSEIIGLKNTGMITGIASSTYVIACGSFSGNLTTTESGGSLAGYS